MDHPTGDPLEGRDLVLPVLRELLDELANGAAESEWENLALAHFLEALHVLVEDVAIRTPPFRRRFPAILGR